MLQRIQTVFLVLAAACLVVHVFLPIWFKFPESGEFFRLNALYFQQKLSADAQSTYVYWPYSLTGVFSVAAIFITITSIAKYKNRPLQMRLGALNNLLIIGIIACGYIFSGQLQEEFMPEVVGKLSMGFFLPAVAAIFNILSNRFIQRDEKLVKSVDRIR
ncbi:MAG: DUF4293 domain-containing protein [Bacteroidota bacterium]